MGLAGACLAINEIGAIIAWKEGGYKGFTGIFEDCGLGGGSRENFIKGIELVLGKEERVGREDFKGGWRVGRLDAEKNEKVFGHF